MTTRSVHVDPKAAAAYVRRLPGMGKEIVQQTITELEAFAARRGFGLADVHYEERPNDRLRTWAALIATCRSQGIVNVLVPSPEHFHHDPLVADFMREDLASAIKGTVWYVGESAAASTTDATHHER